MTSLVTPHKLLVFGEEDRVREGVTADEYATGAGSCNKSILDPPVQGESLEPLEHVVDKVVEEDLPGDGKQLNMVCGSGLKGEGERL